MNRLAEQADIPQPRLRGACFKGTCPTPETLRKLSRVMGVNHYELYTLAYEGRREKLEPETADDFLDSFIRELLETAREMGLEPPQALPPKATIQKALMELGFNIRKDCA